MVNAARVDETKTSMKLQATNVVRDDPGDDGVQLIPPGERNDFPDKCPTDPASPRVGRVASCADG